MDYVFQVIIAPSFADIFYNNSFKNGLVPIVVDSSQVKEWQSAAESGELNLTVDLEKRAIVEENGNEISFVIPEYHRQNLLNGWDEIALTLQLEDKISNFEQTTL